MSLAVADIAASKAFYGVLGFDAVMGDEAQGWLIVRTSATTIGLFQGVLEHNLLTFNPGWDSKGEPLAELDDIRVLQRRFKAAGLALDTEVDESTSGPASLTLHDPDGTAILFDQHRD